MPKGIIPRGCKYSIVLHVFERRIHEEQTVFFCLLQYGLTGKKESRDLLRSNTHPTLIKPH